MIYGYDSVPSTSGALPCPPQEMPGTEQGFTEGFCGILADEMKVTVDLQEIFLHHALTGKMVILRKELYFNPFHFFHRKKLVLNNGSHNASEG